MAKKVNLSEILKNGTPKQKALLLIQNDEAEAKIGVERLLTDSEVVAIKKSTKTPEEARELNRYLCIADKYIVNRHLFYSLQENLKKLLARIVNYTALWEKAEREAELYNTLLGLLDVGENQGRRDFSNRKGMESTIYDYGKHWDILVTIERKEDSREVEVNLARLMSALNQTIDQYKISFSIAKAYVEASDAFVAKYKASAFIPEDVRLMFEYFKNPKREVPEIYRRDSYLKLLKEKGAEDREVKFRERYAILPAYEDVEPAESATIKELFTL